MIYRGQGTDFVAAAFWEEHCVECGAPACYATCEKYESGPGGRCRLFKGGLQHRLNGDVGVEFKEWGKLELRYVGKMASSRTVRLLRALGLERLNPEFRYRILCHFLTTAPQPEIWKMRFLVEKPVDLIAAIVDADKGELLSRRIKADAGEHHFEFKVPKLTGTTFFRVSAINGTPCPVVFKEMVVGANRPKTNPAQFVKCVAWDLDNTLWDGILSNDGPEGVKLRGEILEAMKTLDSRGILNTICSKNDFDDAWAKLKELGIHEYFVFPQINWNPKSENLKKAAKEINIGIDTFAFVDDSPHERGEVGENLPMVRVFKETEINKLLSDKALNPPVSSESAKRRFSYLAEMTRRTSEASFEGDHDAFLRSCEIVLMLDKLEDEATKKRCWELVNRTNQLTLAARRYAEEEFGQLVKSAECFAIRCKDKYGDYGIVGFVAVRESGRVEGVERVDEVAEFVMSCRVAKKRCEDAVVDALASRAQGQGAKLLFADVVETGRNKALVEAFDALPGIEKQATEKGLRYTLKLTSRKQENIPVEVVVK